MGEANMEERKIEYKNHQSINSVTHKYPLMSLSSIILIKIMVYERKGEGLDIEVEWNTPFMVVSE